MIYIFCKLLLFFLSLSLDDIGQKAVHFSQTLQFTVSHNALKDLTAVLKVLLTHINFNSHQT